MDQQMPVELVALLFVSLAVKLTATCQESITVLPRLSEPDAGLTLFTLR